MGAERQHSVMHVPDRAFNDRRYFVDSSKLESLGWSQKVDWHEGLVRLHNLNLALLTFI